MEQAEWTSLRVLVVGLGLTGVGAAEKLVELGCAVSASDNAETDKVKEAAGRLAARGVRTKIGEVAPADLRGIDLVVVSPGVPPESPSMAVVQDAGVETISEIELAWRLCSGTVVAITGTNGKTTTTMLTGELLAAAGRHVVVAGNIGNPFVTAVRSKDEDTTYVVEVSSFQLHNVTSFRPNVAVVLNITPDHLNWHKTMGAYVRAKERIFACQRHSDFAVLNFDDTAVRDMTRIAPGRIIPFSRQPLGEGVYVSGGIIVEKLNSRQERIMATDKLKIIGSHNVENALAAAGAALACGVEIPKIAAALAAFKGVEHRLEKARAVDGAVYWNDSKATNPDATIKALESFDRPIIVLVGGRNKGNPFDDLARVAANRAKLAIAFGEARDEIEASMREAGVAVESVPTMAAAVEFASGRATGGDNVVLSPACASFDEFEDFEHRGRVFKEVVGSLRGEAR